MANSWNGHQIIVDTPTTNSIVGNTNIKIKSGIWQGMTAPATLVLTDLAGRTFTYNAYQTNYQIDIGSLGWINGLTVPTISSGKVYFYTDK